MSEIVRDHERKRTWPNNLYLYGNLKIEFYAIGIVICNSKDTNSNNFQKGRAAILILENYFLQNFHFNSNCKNAIQLLKKFVNFYIKCMLK